MTTDAQGSAIYVLRSSKSHIVEITHSEQGYKGWYKNFPNLSKMLHLPILPSFQRSNTKEAEGVQKLHEIVCNIQTMGFWSKFPYVKGS